MSKMTDLGKKTLNEANDYQVCNGECSPEKFVSVVQDNLIGLGYSEVMFRRAYILETGEPLFKVWLTEKNISIPAEVHKIPDCSLDSIMEVLYLWAEMGGPSIPEIFGVKKTGSHYSLYYRQYKDSAGI